MIFAFLLEIAMFVCIAIWGWSLGSGWLTSALISTALVVILGAVWGLCRTPGDLPHGRARIPVSGPVRFTVELGVLALAAYGVWAAGSRAASETLLTAAVIHYALTWERIRWLLLRSGGR